MDKIVAIHDVGRVINPLGASSQVEGGIIQGIGHTLSEERHRRPGDGIDPDPHARRLPDADDRRRPGDRHRPRRRSGSSPDESRREGPRRAADHPHRRCDRERDPRRDGSGRPLAADQPRGDAARAATRLRSGEGAAVELLRPSSADEATAALGNGSVALAGGTELVPLLRDGLVRADDARRCDAGRAARNRRRHASVPARPSPSSRSILRYRRRCARRASLAASPQLRAMGSIGGNLLQATRCWYWRLGFDCWLHGGEQCFAKDGAHREHAIFGNEHCASAHPSDVAAALLALGASIRTTGARAADRASSIDFRRTKTDDTTTLEPDELILELDVPEPRVACT